MKIFLQIWKTSWECGRCEKRRGLMLKLENGKNKIKEVTKQQNSFMWRETNQRMRSFHWSFEMKNKMSDVPRCKPCELKYQTMFWRHHGYYCRCQKLIMKMIEICKWCSEGGLQVTIVIEDWLYIDCDELITVIYKVEAFEGTGRGTLLTNKVL